MAAAIATAAAGAVVTGAVNKAMAPDVGPTGLTQQSDEYTRQLAQQAQKYGAFWESDYKPVEERLAQEALVAGSPEEQERMATLASTDVETAFKRGRHGMQMGATRRGIRTNSPAYIAAMAGIQRDEAKTSATSRNLARRQERDYGFRQRLAAGQLGRGLVGASQQGIGQAAGQSGALASGDFFRQQFLGEQARRGLAPVTGAIGEEVGKRVGGWVRKTFPKSNTQQNSSTWAVPMFQR